MTFLKTEMKEYDRSAWNDTHNTRLLIRTPQVCAIQTEGAFTKKEYADKHTHTRTHAHTHTNTNTHTHTFIVSCGVSYFHKLVLAVSKTGFSGYTKVTNTSTLKILTMD